MIKKISVISVLAFSLVMFGNQVNAEYNGTGTNGMNTNNYNTDYRTRTTAWGTDNRDVSPGYGSNRGTDGVRTTAVDDTPRRDWGWLGLLGLAGLAGLGGRNRNNDPERQR